MKKESNQQLFTGLALMSGMALAMHYLSSDSDNLVEHFGTLPPRTVKAQRVSETGPRKGDFVEVPGNYQAMLSPRFSNIDYGAHIRYNMPGTAQQGVPPDSPIAYGNLVYDRDVQLKTCKHCDKKASTQLKEGYCASCSSVVGCRKGGGGQPKTSNLVPSDYKASNYQSLLNQSDYTETTDLLPVQDMSGPVAVNALGQETTQPIIYDRYIYANQRSRLYGQGDPIRGDLPIVPMRNEWFRPSVHPQIDLRDGAILAMSGANNDTSKELLALQNAASGGYLDTGSGVNYAVQKSMFSSGAGGDVNFTSFP